MDVVRPVTILLRGCEMGRVTMKGECAARSSVLSSLDEETMSASLRMYYVRLSNAGVFLRSPTYIELVMCTGPTVDCAMIKELVFFEFRLRKLTTCAIRLNNNATKNLNALIV